MSLERCGEQYKLYPGLEEKILEIVSGLGTASFDEVRDRLEAQGIYMDGRCLRLAVAGMVRRKILDKIPDPASRKLKLSASRGGADPRRA